MLMKTSDFTNTSIYLVIQLITFQIDRNSFTNHKAALQCIPVSHQSTGLHVPCKTYSVRYLLL